VEPTWVWHAPYALDTSNSPLTSRQWAELEASVVGPLQIMPPVVPGPRWQPPRWPAIDWTSKRGLGCSDCIADAELARAPVDAVVDALAGNARTVVRDVFGKRAPITTHHRLVFRLRGHDWTCLVKVSRSHHPLLISPEGLSERLAVPVIYCSVSDSSNDAAFARTEHGQSEHWFRSYPEDGLLRVQLRGRELTAKEPFELLDACLRSEDAWWDPSLTADRFIEDRERWLGHIEHHLFRQWGDPPIGLGEVQFASKLEWLDQELPVEASAWIAW
jgi:hypothetical protein